MRKKGNKFSCLHQDRHDGQVQMQILSNPLLLYLQASMWSQDPEDSIIIRRKQDQLAIDQHVDPYTL